jgi:type IV pilus assembly protein PilW
MTKQQTKTAFPTRQAGITLVELMVALAIGSFLMIGAVQVYSQSHQAFKINESIARVQETAQFAMDTIEADLRMASNWGQHSRGSAIEGRSTVLLGIVTANPLGLPVPGACGAEWATDLSHPVVGENNNNTLPCGAVGGVQANSDTVTTRRATVAATALQAGRLQVQSTRIQGELFADGNVPADFDPLDSQTHDLLVNTYYVAADSALIPGVPSLRRKSLVTVGGAPTIADQEIAPGVENIQLQFGVDVNKDNTVDRYVNPGDPILDRTNVAFIPGASVMTARIWLIIRSVSIEVGLQDNVNYQPGDVNLGTYNDSFRRMQVSKTILLRNART